ncbi:very-long-chain (3R)-3-hydroxyacyl-CoA dehydratase [Malassezia vespertilionis]|uniref:Very-long-chain (3R)-3-hydroxyacyl-CoA dehydratase n=1 Tax=Malassezia vespertilionis TaxID=2020962 RepID=A0A2N1JBN5_9BASI|nr:very-long-chain (3R)-3-hydroxyacyl-CoA dehydratase [Malassezia vespertilionis]PKI83946.1 hypothetical protein MVES_002068 [Malassezia vespertilionis]WFD06838.1 very-long-chain (3R)-3-hydroxyacyl-CoA dehydratase [Malassezia vespertilionis]
MNTTAASKPKKHTSPLTTFYLCVYNLLQFVGWLRIFIGFCLQMIQGEHARRIMYVSVGKFVDEYTPDMIHGAAPSFSQYNPIVAEALTRLSRMHGYLGPLVVIFQTLAVFEVFHALFGLVQANPIMVALQVASRIAIIWGVVEKYTVAASSPWYGVLVFAWSLSEITRYPFYVNQLLNSPSFMALWSRYSFFIVLYPLGVLSEMSLIWLTLPKTNEWPWINQTGWTQRDMIFLGALPIYVPGLFILYSHLWAARVKVLGSDFAGSKGRAMVDKKRDEYLSRFRKITEKTAARSQTVPAAQ